MSSTSRIVSTTSPCLPAPSASTPSRPERPNADLLYDEIAGLFCFDRAKPYFPRQSVVESPHHHLQTQVAPDPHYTFPNTPRRPDPTTSSLQPSPPQPNNIFSPRLGQGLESLNHAGVKARQERRDSDILIPIQSTSALPPISPSLSSGSNSPLTPSHESDGDESLPASTFDPPSQTKSPPRTLPRSPIARIWPQFLKWKATNPTTSSPLKNPILFTPGSPDEIDSFPIHPPVSPYLSSSPKARRLLSPTMQQMISPVSPDLVTFTSPPLPSKVYTTDREVHFTDDAMKTPKTNRSPTKMSPSSGYSPRSFRAKGTETSPTTLASSGMSSITAWDRDERPRFENGMDMTSLEYGKVGKMIYNFYPIYVFFHIPAQLFLDYNLVYILVLLSLSPSFPTTTIEQYYPSFIKTTVTFIDVPKVQSSTPFWIGLAFYIAFTLAWFVGICIWRAITGWRRRWEDGIGEVEAVYENSSSFDFACLLSLSYFSFLHRARFAPFSRSQQGLFYVDGSSLCDGIAEACAWNIQNWPTALLILPRAVISLVILLIYGTTAYGSSTNITAARTSIYFLSNGVLSSYGAGIIITNCCWTAYRLLILLCSYLGFFLLTHPIFRFPSSRPQTCSPHHHPSQEIIRRYQDSDFKHLEEGRSPVSVDSPSFLNKDWRDRRRERLQLAWNLCSRSGGGITTPGSFRESSKNRNLDYPSTPSPVWLAVDRFTHERKLEKMNRRSQRAAEKAEATKVGEAPFSPRSPKVNKGKAPKWRGIAPYVTSPPTVCISPLESSPSPQARSLPFSAPPLLAPPSPILHSNYDRLSTLSTPQLFSCFSNVTNDTATSSDPRSPSPTRSQLQQYPFSVPPVIVLAPDSSDGASTLDPFAFDRDIVELSSARGGITFTNPFTSPRSPPSPASPSPATFADLSTPVSVGSDALRLVTARKPVERRKALLEQIQNFTNEERELDRQEVLRRRSRSMRASLQEPRRPSIECDRVVDQGAALSIPPSAAASLYSPPSRESLIVRMSTPSSAEWLENRVRLNSHRASIS